MVSFDQSYTDEFRQHKTEENILLNLFSNNLKEYNTPISPAELQLTLQNYVKNMTLGLNDILAAFLRHLPPKMLDKLLTIYNKIWKTNCFPSIWYRHSHPYFKTE